MNLTPRQYLHEVGYSKIGKIGCGFCGPYVSGLQCADTLRDSVDHKLGLSIGYIGYIQAFKCFSFLLFLIIITDKPEFFLQSVDSEFRDLFVPQTFSVEPGVPNRDEWRQCPSDTWPRVRSHFWGTPKSCRIEK